MDLNIRKMTNHPPSPDFYNSISIENRYFVKECSNYARIIKQIQEKPKFASLA